MEEKKLDLNLGDILFEEEEDEYLEGMIENANEHLRCANASKDWKIFKDRHLWIERGHPVRDDYINLLLRKLGIPKTANNLSEFGRPIATIVKITDEEFLGIIRRSSYIPGCKGWVITVEPVPCMELKKKLIAPEYRISQQGDGRQNIILRSGIPPVLKSLERELDQPGMPGEFRGLDGMGNEFTYTLHDLGCRHLLIACDNDKVPYHLEDSCDKEHENEIYLDAHRINLLRERVSRAIELQNQDPAQSKNQDIVGKIRRFYYCETKNRKKQISYPTRVETITLREIIHKIGNTSPNNDSDNDQMPSPMIPYELLAKYKDVDKDKAEEIKGSMLIEYQQSISELKVTGKKL